MERAFWTLFALAGLVSVLWLFGVLIREWWKERGRVGYWLLFALLFPVLLFFLKDIFTR